VGASPHDRRVHHRRCREACSSTAATIPGRATGVGGVWGVETARLRRLRDRPEPCALGPWAVAGRSATVTLLGCSVAGRSATSTLLGCSLAGRSATVTLPGWSVAGRSAIGALLGW